MNIKESVWTLKYAPSSIEEMILSDENRKYFSSLTDIPANLLFVGDPGCGKTTLAKLLAKKFAPNSYLYINASSEGGIETVRTVIASFISTVSFDGKQKIVILDEADGLSNSSQGALRNIMEEYLNDVKFILTGNYSHKIIEALVSRCQSFSFSITFEAFFQRIKHIILNEKVQYDKPTNILEFSKKYYPDLRRTLNELQKSCNSGTFNYKKGEGQELVNKIFESLKKKEDVFKIREYVIADESLFHADYHFLMRNLFNLYILNCNIQACTYIADHMAKDAIVLDKEVNFCALIFNLSKL